MTLARHVDHHTVLNTRGFNSTQGELWTEKNVISTLEKTQRYIDAESTSLLLIRRRYNAMSCAPTGHHFAWIKWYTLKILKLKRIEKNRKIGIYYTTDWQKKTTHPTKYFLQYCFDISPHDGPTSKQYWRNALCLLGCVIYGDRRFLAYQGRTRIL